MGWHVTHLTDEAALRHERRIRGLSDDITLGWTPYNYIVERGAINQWACHTEADFERKLRRCNLVVGEWRDHGNGIKSAPLIEVDYRDPAPEPAESLKTARMIAGWS